MSVGRGPRALRIPRRVLLWRGRVVLSASVTLRGHRCPAAAVMASPHPGPGSGRAGPSPLCMPQGRRRFPVSPSPEPATRGAGRVWFSRSPRGFWAASWCQASKSRIGALCGAADVRDGTGNPMCPRKGTHLHQKGAPLRVGAAHRPKLETRCLVTLLCL